MSKKFDIEVKYKVIEALTVEADTIEQAEQKALEFVALNVTDKNIIADTQDEAEIFNSMEHEAGEGEGK